MTVRKKEKLEKGALLKEDGKYTVPEADEMIEKFSQHKHLATVLHWLRKVGSSGICRICGSRSGKAGQRLLWGSYCTTA